MTERRRKTRKTELKHGDLFHVYIASDAPQEVCDFLTDLKQNGDFSYEIIQIIAKHVKQVQFSKTAPTQQSVQADGPSAASATPSSPVAQPVGGAAEQTAATNELSDAVAEPSVDGADDVESSQAVPANTPAESVPAASTQAPEQPEADEPPFDPVALLRRQRRAWVGGK